MKNLLENIKLWAIDNKYFFSIGAMAYTMLFLVTVVAEADVVVRKIFFSVTLFFSLVTYWLVRGGHYGDMDCE